VKAEWKDSKNPIVKGLGKTGDFLKWCWSAIPN